MLLANVIGRSILQSRRMAFSKPRWDAQLLTGIRARNVVARTTADPCLFAFLFCSPHLSAAKSCRDAGPGRMGPITISTGYLFPSRTMQRVVSMLRPCPVETDALMEIWMSECRGELF